MLLNRTVRPDMTAEDVEMWRTLVANRSGLFFTDSRLYFLGQRLWERMRQHGLASYTDYYRYVMLDRNGEQEWTALLQGLVNNETRFFRHEPSFTAMRDRVLPQLWQQKQAQDGLNLWSVGCSSGQEVYSLAMLLLETAVFSPHHIHITGSDISESKLTQAKNGRYRHFEIRSLPEAYRRKYMREYQQGHDQLFEVRSPLRQITEFRYLNLQAPDDYTTTQYDVVFCQNVLVYFSNETRLKILQRLCEQITLGGYLFLAPTDVVSLRLPGMRPVYFPDALVYQRVAHTATEN